MRESRRGALCGLPWSRIGTGGCIFLIWTIYQTLCSYSSNPQGYRIRTLPCWVGVASTISIDRRFVLSAFVPVFKYWAIPELEIIGSDPGLLLSSLAALALILYVRGLFTIVTHAMCKRLISLAKPVSPRSCVRSRKCVGGAWLHKKMTTTMSQASPPHYLRETGFARLLRNRDSWSLTGKHVVGDRDEDELSVVTKAQQLAVSSGITLQGERVGVAPNPCPIHSPFPSPFPRHELEYAKSLQPDISELINRISRDHEFLKKTLQKQVASVC